MKQKGFTLIELLGVVVILAVLATIAIPVVNNSISQNKEKLYQTQINQIIKGAEDYYATHISELPENSGDTESITLSELQKAGNLEYDIENPKTGKNFDPNTTVIKITKSNNNYKYIVDEETIQ